jgi:hypothetical protein
MRNSKTKIKTKVKTETTVSVGSLDEYEIFHLKRLKQQFKTLLTPFSKTYPSMGSRMCLNLKTLELEYFPNGLEVVRVS